MAFIPLQNSIFRDGYFGPVRAGFLFFYWWGRGTPFPPHVIPAASRCRLGLILFHLSPLHRSTLCLWFPTRGEVNRYVITYSSLYILHSNSGTASTLYLLYIFLTPGISPVALVSYSLMTLLLIHKFSLLYLLLLNFLEKAWSPNPNTEALVVVVAM